MADDYYFSGKAVHGFERTICPITNAGADPAHCAWGVPLDDQDAEFECCALLHAVQCLHEGVEESGRDLAGTVYEPRWAVGVPNMLDGIYVKLDAIAGTMGQILQAVDRIDPPSKGSD